MRYKNEQLFLDLLSRSSSIVNYTADCKTMKRTAITGMPAMTTVNLPKCVNMGGQALDGNSKLTSVYLPKCDVLGYCALANCKSLTTVELPECTYIADGFDNPPICIRGEFENCTSLTTVIVPKLKYLGLRAFLNCTALTKLVIGTNNGNVVCQTGIDIFQNAKIPTIYVPSDMVTAYKTSTNWSPYASYIKAY